MDQQSSSSASVLATGLYGAANLGDDLLMEVFAETIGEAGLTPVIGAYDLKVAGDSTGCRAVPCPRLSPRLPAFLLGFAREVRRSRAVVFGGGGLFQDTHSAYTVAEYAVAGAIALVLGRPLIVWGVGLGPFRHALNETLMRWTLSLAATVAVRDRESARLTGRPDAAVVEDPVWWLARGGVAGAPSPADGPIAFVFREWPGVSPEDAAALVSRVCAQVGASAVILPFEYSRGLTRDWAFSEQIAALCRRAGVEVTLPLSPDYPSATEIRAALRGSRALLTMRFHGAILGIIEGVPVLAFDCVPKLVHLFAEVGLPDRVVRLSELRTDAPLRAVSSLLAARDAAFASQRAPFASRPTSVAAFQEALSLAPSPSGARRLKGAFVLVSCLALLSAGVFAAGARKIGRALRRGTGRVPRATAT